MPLAALVCMPCSLDTGCTALPEPVSMNLLELFQSSLQHQEYGGMVGSSVPKLRFTDLRASLKGGGGTAAHSGQVLTSILREWDTKKVCCSAFYLKSQS